MRPCGPTFIRACASKFSTLSKLCHVTGIVSPDDRRKSGVQAFGGEDLFAEHGQDLDGDGGGAVGGGQHVGARDEVYYTPRIFTMAFPMVSF